MKKNCLYGSSFLFTKTSERSDTLFGFNNPAADIANMIALGASQKMTDRQFLEHEIAQWKNSPARLMQIKGYLYYDGEHDILKRKRTAIGEKGKLQEIDNLPNNRIVDNQYGKLVNQKANYLLGQPFVIESDNEQYAKLLKQIFNKRFMKLLKNAGKAALNGGIAWLYPYYDENGEFAFRLFPAYEILPFWRDSEHTKLDLAVRLYSVISYEGTTPKAIEKVEVYDLSGVHRYVLDGGILTPDVSERGGSDSPHIITTDSQGKAFALNWSRIPLIALKYNETENSLLKKVKSLQDGINVMLSDFENNMQEDARNTILVLKNYDGENLSEFRRNLASYGAVKVRYDGETKGGVETLEVNVNCENYKSIIEIFKKAIIENGMGYDAKDDRLSGNPNQMNIQSMYSDIDLDANDTETELQAAFEDMLWFINAHLANTGKGNFEDEDVTVIFNRDILINESEAIANCRDSVGLLSDETIVGQHPWIDDPQKELERIEKQRQKEQAQMQDYEPFEDSSHSGDIDE